jgi:hypothetical protein
MSAHPTESRRVRSEVWNADHRVEFVLEQSQVAESAVSVKDMPGRFRFRIQYHQLALTYFIAERNQTSHPLINDN